MAGKGSKPRNCFSENYFNNYDTINWGTKSVNKLSGTLKVIDKIQQLKKKLHQVCSATHNSDKKSS